MASLAVAVPFSTPHANVQSSNNVTLTGPGWGGGQGRMCANYFCVFKLWEFKLGDHLIGEFIKT